MHAARIVVFDLDLTLTRWDTADRFFRWLLRRDPWRAAVVVCAVPLLGPLLLFKSTRKWPIRFAVWVATWGRPLDELPALVQEHIQSLPSGVPNKIPMLVARGFAPPWSIAYTDHHADLPVLQLASERYLVSPKPRCRARIEQVLAIEATVLPWRQ